MSDLIYRWTACTSHSFLQSTWYIWIHRKALQNNGEWKVPRPQSALNRSIPTPNLFLWSIILNWNRTAVPRKVIHFESEICNPFPTRNLWRKKSFFITQLVIKEIQKSMGNSDEVCRSICLLGFQLGSRTERVAYNDTKDYPVALKITCR